MAILICTHATLRDPEKWAAIDGYFDYMEVVKNIPGGTVMRVLNREVPEKDYLIDVFYSDVPDFDPIIISFTVYQLYQL